MPKFEKGWKGGPGRPPGSRNKLAEKFLTVLFNDFNEHGEGAIQRVRVSDPSTYVRTVASVIPKEITGEDGHPLFDQVKVIFVKSDRKKEAD
jgi:hypothetical protein